MTYTRTIDSRKPETANFFSSAPFIGRDSVLNALRARDKRAVMLIGEPGIGKTRLLTEARHRVVDAKVFAVTCLPDARELPLDPLLAAVRAMHRLGCIPSAAFKAVVGCAERDRLSYIRDAVETALSSEPLVFQFDDVQWADGATLGALDYLIDRLQDLELRWQLAARPGSPKIEELAIWLERSGHGERLMIEPFTQRELGEFVRALLIDIPVDDSFVARLHDRTGGNPLYTQLLLADGNFSSPVPPKDLRSLLRSRLRSLSPAATTIAGWLAVHRGPLNWSALLNLTSLPAAHVHRALTELVDSATVRPIDDAYVFRHELLRDACYEALTDVVRGGHHAALALRTGDDWQRAKHFDGASLYREAVELWLRIGWNRLDRHAPEEARSAFSHALDRADSQSVEAWQARAGMAAARLALGERSEAVTCMREFEANSDKLAPAARVGAEARFAEVAWEYAEDDAAASIVLDRALAEAPSCAPDMLPRLQWVLGGVLDRRDRLSEAAQAFERGLEYAAKSDEPVRIRLHAWLGVVRGRSGSARAGIELVESAAERAARLCLGNELAQCCVKLCYLYGMVNDFDRYEYWCRRGLEVAVPKSRRLEAILRLNLAGVLMDRGRMQGALGLAISAAGSLDQTNADIRCCALTYQANAWAKLGDFESARTALAQADQLEVNDRWKRLVVYTRAIAAELEEDYVRAIERYEEALGHRRAAFGETFEIRALTGIVRCAAALGDLQRAATATERLREADRRGWQLVGDQLVEAEGYENLIRGNVVAASACLQRAIETRAEAYWRAHLRLEVAKLSGSRDLFLETIDEFDAMGAVAAADRARGIARTRGLRPGRKRAPRGVLSDREHAVAMLVANGKTNVEIGQTLHISANTVNYHIGNTLAKCGLRSRVEIAARVANGTLNGPADRLPTTGTHNTAQPHDV